MAAESTGVLVQTTSDMFQCSSLETVTLRVVVEDFSDTFANIHRRR